MERYPSLNKKAYISLLLKGGDRSLPSRFCLVSSRCCSVAATLRPNWIRAVHSADAATIPRSNDFSKAARLGNGRCGASKLCESIQQHSPDGSVTRFSAHELRRQFLPPDRNSFRHTLVSVLENGSASEIFKIECGVRQGNPLSSAHFVLFIEPLLCFLRFTWAFKSLDTKKHTTCLHLLMFARDCCVTLEMPWSSLTSSIRTPSLLAFAFTFKRLISSLSRRHQ